MIMFWVFFYVSVDAYANSPCCRLSKRYYDAYCGRSSAIKAADWLVFRCGKCSHTLARIHHRSFPVLMKHGDSFRQPTTLTPLTDSQSTLPRSGTLLCLVSL